MSHPNPEIKLEVDIFEGLERYTQLRLGDIVQLRRQSRHKQINLLFLAYQEGFITQINAEHLAQELKMETQRAPWMKSNPRVHEGYVSLSQRRQEYDSTF